MHFNKFMALFDDKEPLSDIQPEVKNLSSNATYSRLERLLGWKRYIEEFQLKERLGRFFSGAKVFLTGNKYLPHCALVLLGLVVAISNFSQKMTALAYNNEIATLNPDTLYSVSQSVDYYTPIIGNDSDVVQNVITAYSNSDGFAANLASVSTEVTDRVDPAIIAANDNSDKTINYTIQNGDTLTGLGWKYGVKLATLKYVNNIDNEDMIKPGMAIKIPPKGYEVSATLIAKRENDKAAKLAAANRNTVTRSSSTARIKSVSAAPGKKANGYPYGYCTYYVATRRAVPTGWGDAKNWFSSAKRAGWSTGSAPVVGAIMVTSESFWGHVAYVESVDGNSFTVSEMNYKGWGVTSRRTISIGSGFIKGFVY